MLVRRQNELPYSEITDERTVRLWMGRRRFLFSAAVVGAATAFGGRPAFSDERVGPIFTDLARSPFSTGEPPTSYKDATNYNNYYEFSTDKEEPAVLARSFQPRPWTISVEGSVSNPRAYDVGELFVKPFVPEERVYRLRCVEAWSMVIPWIGIPLRNLLQQAAPTSTARYVEFVSLHDPKRMPGQRRSVLDWPYREGLRLDEAMHPLTILAVGMYGAMLPNQNGAPVRLVVPWKYGFKSIKAITTIRLTDTQPNTTWSSQNRKEYGFYANVNPAVDHPRWSQARERRIGDFFKRETLPFNGYGDQVAHLYSGMDLAIHF